MVTLCSNRPEGFGPHSRIHPNLPTTCFDDVVVVPLATWIYMLSAPLMILFYMRGRSKAYKFDESDHKSLLSRIMLGIYYVLIIAMLAMPSLQIARLTVAHLGIGLLPFTYVGVLMAAGVHTLIKTRLARAFSALYWIMLAVAMALELAALRMEEGRYNRVGVANNYPLGDEVTDMGTMIGVEVVLAILEIIA